MCTMLKLLCLLGLIVGTHARSPLLVWSDSADRSGFKFPHGKQFGYSSLVEELIKPQCVKTSFVVIEVPQLKFSDLSPISSGSKYEWKFLQKLLINADVEKIFSFDGDNTAGMHEDGCKISTYRWAQEMNDKQSLSDFVDQKLAELMSKTEFPSNTVFILHGSNPIPSLRADTVQEDSPYRRLLRRSAEAEADPTDASGDPQGLYVATKCVQFYVERMEVVPLGKLRKDQKTKPSSNYPVASIAIADSQCDSNTSVSLTLTLTLNNSDTIVNKPPATTATLYMSLEPLMGYSWYVKVMNVTLDGITSPINPWYIQAPLIYSYACQEPLVMPAPNPDGQDAYSKGTYNVWFGGLQMGTNLGNITDDLSTVNFTSAVDCQSVFGQGAAMGFTYVLLLVIILLYTTAMFTALKNPMFGDKTIVVAQE